MTSNVENNTQYTEESPPLLLSRYVYQTPSLDNNCSRL